MNCIIQIPDTVIDDIDCNLITTSNNPKALNNGHLMAVQQDSFYKNVDWF